MSEFISSRITILSSNKNRIRDDQKEEIDALSNNVESSVLLLAKLKDFQSDELLAYACAKLFPTEWVEGDENHKKAQRIATALTNPNRLYRMLSVLNGNDPDTSEKVCLKLTSRMRKFIVTTLQAAIAKNGFESTYAMMNSNSVAWKLILKAIHTNEKRFQKDELKEFQLLAAAFRGNILDEDQLALAARSELEIEEGKVRVVCSEHKFMAALKSNNKELAIELMLSNRGLVYRYLRLFIETFGDAITAEDILMISQNGLSQLAVNQLMDLRDVLAKHISLQQMDEASGETLLEKGKFMNHPVVLTSNGKLKADYKIKATIKEDLIKNMLNAIKINMVNKIKKNSDIDTVLLDTDSVNQLVNKGEYSKSVPFTDNILSRGDRIVLSDTTKLVAYIYWQNCADGRRVDLDLSVYGLDESFNMSQERDWLCDYTSLRGFNGKMLHSGDITNAPQPASEYVTFDLSEIEKNPNCPKWIVITALSYNGIAFDDMQHALVGLGKIVDGETGSGPQGSHTLGASMLKGKSKVNTCAVINVHEKTFEFVNINKDMKSRGRQSYSVSSHNNELSSSLAQYMRWSNYFSPVSHRQVGLHLALKYDRFVLKKNSSYLLLERSRDETGVDFFDRLMKVLNSDNVSKLPSDSSGSGQAMTEEEYLRDNKDVKVIYVGNSDVVGLPSGSIILNKMKPSRGTEGWITDAYSVLSSDIKAVETDNIDNVYAILGQSTVVERAGLKFTTRSIQPDGNCMFNAANSQTREEFKRPVSELRAQVVASLRSKLDSNGDFLLRLIGYIVHDWVESSPVSSARNENTPQGIFVKELRELQVTIMTKLSEVDAEHTAAGSDAATVQEGHIAALRHTDIQPIVTRLVDMYMEILATDPEGEGVTTVLPNYMYWGGNLELETLSNILHLRIGVIIANNPIIQYYPNEPVDGYTMGYVYYTGSHYNAAIIDETSEDVMKGGGNSLSSLSDKYRAIRYRYTNLKTGVEKI